MVTHHSTTHAGRAMKLALGCFYSMLLMIALLKVNVLGRRTTMHTGGATRFVLDYFGSKALA